MSPLTPIESLELELAATDLIGPLERDGPMLCPIALQVFYFSFPNTF